MRKILSNKPVISWAMYDWANSAFATTVMAGFFPIFFKQYWSQDIDAAESTLFLGAANSTASLVLALIAPLLGSLADRGGYKKEILFLTTGIGVLSTLALFFIPEGYWPLAALTYAIAAFGFMASMIPYDSLLIDVTQGKRMDRVSGLGFGLGYLGGGLLFVLNVLWYLQPQWFGIPDGATAVRLSFLSVSIWWVLFSIPLFLNVRERREQEIPLSSSLIRDSWHDVFKTLREITAHKEILLFLLAYFFYIEGVNTTVKMAVDYGLSLGFDSANLITALLIVQFVAFPFAILFGWIGERFGPRNGLYLGISIYIIMAMLAYRMTEVWQFYWMAVAIGMVQGGVQSLSRSLYAAKIPPERAAQFFGFFNMLGKFSAVLGPILVGISVQLSGTPRATSLVLLVFFVCGLILLWMSSRHAGKTPSH
ncbi:MAG: MFS transporter [Gammaproteobacteria bacterium]|nr:MFS transporter [Gammaproteobacteria bacterium]